MIRIYALQAFQTGLPEPFKELAERIPEFLASPAANTTDLAWMGKYRDASCISDNGQSFICRDKIFFYFLQLRIFEKSSRFKSLRYFVDIAFFYERPCKVGFSYICLAISEDKILFFYFISLFSDGF